MNPKDRVLKVLEGQLEAASRKWRSGNYAYSDDGERRDAGADSYSALFEVQLTLEAAPWETIDDVLSLIEQVRERTTDDPMNVKNGTLNSLAGAIHEIKDSTAS